MKFLLGKKLGMSQWWNEKKETEPITLVDCERLLITGKRTAEKDKYDAVCVGIAKKNAQGKKDILKKKNAFELVKEFPLSEPNKFSLTEGERLEVDVFSTGDKVKVSAFSKGKGTQGVVKRHGFAGGPKTHGHRHVLRSGGSIGSAFPEHVQKGKKMAGRMGHSQVTVKNLKVAWVDKDKAIIAIKGAVPGRKGSWVKIIEN